MAAARLTAAVPSGTPQSRRFRDGGAGPARVPFGWGCAAVRTTASRGPGNALVRHDLVDPDGGDERVVAGDPLGLVEALGVDD